ncbi:MAG: AtpZ/AtpI family protein [Thermodesulfobacteriota bacterium]
MSADKKDRETPDKHFIDKIAVKQDRKLRSRRQRDRNVWFGLGMFGLVGWSVAIPTVIGVAVGIWIDETWPSRYSWTLMMLLVGLILGCLNAWFWVKRESVGED